MVVLIQSSVESITLFLRTNNNQLLYPTTLHRQLCFGKKRNNIKLRRNSHLQTPPSSLVDLWNRPTDGNS